MSPVTVMSEELNLPKIIANRLKGKRLELLETQRGILLKPAADFIGEARGILKGSRLSSEKYMQFKRENQNQTNLNNTS